MTSWQDQQERGGRGRTAVDPAAGQPMSRRAAREAERRAAEAGRDRVPHPSGVVDFDAHDFGPEFAPDQDFNVGDTQDIWAALTRGAGRPPATGDLPTGARPRDEGRPGTTDGSAVSGELLDRVRDAVLRRGQEQHAAPTSPGTAAPAAGAGSPGAGALPPAPAPTRRERRLRETADLREDGLPADLFAGPAAGWAPASPAPAEPEPEYDDYFDEPYEPEPTVVIPSLRAMELEAPSPSTSPVALPQAFVEPVGDDALTFSSPVPVARPEAFDDLDEVDADPAFLEPPQAWSAPRPATAPTAAPASPFLVPQQRAATSDAGAAFANPQLGPPSEMTDLAGFEALIRKARQQPAPQQSPQRQQQAPRPAPAAWADEDVQEGFPGLIGRSVQGSHGSANALILPTDPQPDVLQAVSGNGDIFITGSMNLPRSLSTTGTTAEHEAHDVDSRFDDADDETATGVAPVRAARAVSGTGESRVIVNARGRHANVVPTVLAVVAGLMAAGVLTLLIGSWVSGLF